jgi:hypothetical protein
MGKARDWGDVGAEGGPGAIRREGDDPATDIPVDDAPLAQTNGEAYFSEEELRGQKQLPAPPLRGIILSSFKDVEIRRRKWIVPNYIPDGTVTMLSGDGGIGKSLIAKQLAVARALAREWIGLMPEPGRTLMLSCEDDEDELLRRIDSIRKFHGAEWDDLDDFLPIDLVGEDSILGLLKQGIIEPTPMYRSLDVTMGDFKPGLTILDVLADLFCGDERVRTQARQFVNLLKALCRRHRQAILLLAHPSLTGMNSGTGTSGSTDWSNAVRSRLYFHAKDGAVNENVRTLQGKKANYSEVGGPSALADLSGKWIDSVHGRWKAILIPEGIECFHMTDFENWKKPFDFKLGDGTRDYDRHHRILNGLLNIIGRRIPLEWFAAATPQPVFRREK